MSISDRRWQTGSRRQFLVPGLHYALVVGLLIGFASLPARVASAAGSTPTTQPVSTATATAPSLSAVADVLLNAINADRAKLHISRLSLDKRQSVCSRRHSSHMATMGVISHDQFPSDICVRHVLAGENVGFDYGDPTAAVLDLHRMMMAEGPCPRKRCTAGQAETHGHYLNLTNPSFKRVGIGIVLKGEYVWLTENFTS